MIGETPAEPVVAAVDCGTNTIRLLISRAGVPLVRESRIVRLGENVDVTGRLGDQALDRAWTCLAEYAAMMARYPVVRIRFCATSATRDAANAAEFAAGVRARLGVRPEVLTGEEEARLAYAGALAGLRLTGVLPADSGTPGPVLVFDVGGGSTELTLGTPRLGGPTGGAARGRSPDRPDDLAAYSADIGSVRLHERHLHSDPPTAEEIASCVADIERELDACPVEPGRARAVVGVAGTFLTVAAGALGLADYRADRVDHAVLGTPEVISVCRHLTGLSVADRLTLGYVESGRADV
ncbi:MAG: exopolyphosphatase, partial [Nocardioides sp.]